ncbi:3-deoxy-D-manno-octulosonate 8-phosphate phosphatase [Desulfuromonas soudanensis]|uniref:3-deoxy-D-manno-octulosonate 8-phosphate phosphatase KdsC n=1 Tax=Desulfuromonas soudanensis TaxID=1603606 RepID=A0A0M4CW21_9BACT|nr:HAD-IIIA family hydrolase [Desulfuromonas soudanensis]ALC16078.1 3-deoxy-D-manno-octulosonate 8-phosphate phosphatase [Desulfuromonas soudanensis]
MQERLAKIRLLLLDVDGIMTDGRIVYDNNGIETKSFDVKDGHGLKLLQRAGIRIGIITGRQSEVVAFRARELDIDILYQGVKDKLVPYREILDNLGLGEGEVAYMGDDVVDLPILRRVGFAATVADAVPEVAPLVHYVTGKKGGRGAVREVCDLILKEGGHWEGVTARYFQG